MRWTICTVRKVAGLDPLFDVFRKEHLEFAMAVVKEKIIEARRACNDDAAADLSRAKAMLKKRYQYRVDRTCPDCGEPKSAFAERCQGCSLHFRFYNNMLNEKSAIKEHEIETELIAVTPIRQCKGDLARVIDKLASTGQIGDSFVTSKQTTTVNTLARMRGVDVICRLYNPDEKDHKKRKYRVWRADGLDMDQVNEIIRKRLAGEPVPPAPACVPPTPEELEKLKQARWGNRHFTGGRPQAGNNQKKKRQGVVADGA